MVKERPVGEFRIVAAMLCVLCLACALGDVEGDEPGECTDRADNDGDGEFDCDDEDCFGSPDCPADTGEDSAAREYDYCDVHAILTGVCTDCHSPNGGTYPNWESPLALIGQESENNPGRVFIVPGDAQGSFLFAKVSGSQGTAGSRMPLGGELEPRQLRMIEDWIDGGASPDCR